MLIKAIVENFKSFKNRTELSMITSNKIRDKIAHKKSINNLNLLKNAVIYGANASGKSNLIEFFRFFKYYCKILYIFKKRKTLSQKICKSVHNLII